MGIRETHVNHDTTIVNLARIMEATTDSFILCLHLVHQSKTAYYVCAKLVQKTASDNPHGSDYRLYNHSLQTL